MLETGINIEWPSLQYCAMSAFGGDDALQRKAISHKSNFIIIDAILDRSGNTEILA